MRKSSKSRKQGFSVVEGLEARRLLSTSLDGSVLRIICGPIQDNVSVTLNASNQLVVDVNGEKSYFNVDLVNKIYWEGGEGADRFELQRDLTIPVEAWGGKGPDTIITGAGDDTVWGGMGADLIITGNGADLIRAGLGNDRVLSGGKVDTIYGGEGDDTINTGAGNDFVYDSLGNNQIDSGAASVFLPMGRPVFEPMAFMPTVRGYDPNQIRNAYNMGRGETQAQYWNRGAGQTIYIVNAFSGRNTLADLTEFSNQFGLPLPTPETFQIVNEGRRTPAIDAGWAGEINLDVQWAHAIAPGARIVLVQADSNIEPDMYRAVRLAGQLATRDGGGVVSMSFGRAGGLDPTIPWDDMFRSFPRVSFVAASGDAVLAFPGGSPFVTAVGGTNLPLDREGNRTSEESAWILGGSGLVQTYEQPTYQRNFDFGIPGGRGVPDVSYNADPETPFAVYLTTPLGGDQGWFTFGGTSAGAPQWAALVAIANQMRASQGLGSIGSNLNGMLYDMYHQGVGVDTGNAPFYDIIVGSTLGQIVEPDGTIVNTIFNATIGYDLATGLGVPNGDALLYWLTDIDPFFISQNFTFQARMVLAPQFTSGINFNQAYGQPRAGVGYMTGDDLLQLRFETTKTDVLSDPGGLARFDTYFDLQEGQMSMDYVYLYRSGRGQDSGAIYGIGSALIQNYDASYPDLELVPFTLKFEGTWTRASNGRISFSVKFRSVDPFTYEELDRNAEYTFDPSVPTLGAWFEGELKG